MSVLLENFLKDNKDNYITLFLNNGFRLKGNLKSYDDEHLVIRTSSYGSVKDVLVSYTGISTYVPEKV